MSDWMGIMVEVPPEKGQEILQYFANQGFEDVDYCEAEHPDGSRLTFGPCDPRTPQGEQDGNSDAVTRENTP